MPRGFMECLLFTYWHILAYLSEKENDIFDRMACFGRLENTLKVKQFTLIKLRTIFNQQCLTMKNQFHLKFLA